jgi:cell division control protein 45
LEGERKEEIGRTIGQDGVRPLRIYNMSMLMALFRFSIPQTHQPYPHMDLDLKTSLVHKLQAIAPEYGLIELSYPSFTRSFGYRSQPLSASDAVEAVSALLDVAGGVKMEIEVEGGRGGGEWFGRGGFWDGGKKQGVTSEVDTKRVEGDEEGTEEKKEVSWWVHNFWTSFDALSK